MARILYVINPAAFGGQGSGAWERFRKQWPGQIDQKDMLVTKRPGHARGIAASSEGYEILTAVGGDGTASEMLSGIMEHREPRPKLAVVPAGTGNDIARNVGIFSVEEAVAALREEHIRLFDLIRVECRLDGQPTSRYSFLSCNIGFSALSHSMLRPWMKRVFSATGAYYLITFLGLVFYRLPHMTVRWKDREYSGRSWIVLVANSEWMAGGSMRVAPGARTDDGELNVTIVPSQSRVKAMLKMPKIASGTHIDDPDISYFPVEEIKIDSVPPAGMEIDGDLFGTTPATFTVCPRAVRIVSPK